MNFRALITARFAYLPFFAPVAKKLEQTPTPNSALLKRSNTAEKDTQSHVNPYRCTSIVYDDFACAAVKAIGGKKFLAVDRNTPMLPLLECDVSKCKCKYMRHNDRREDDQDRRWVAALKTALYEDSGSEDRRQKRRGRRKTDK